ncbi:MAG TPA: hypothetical protein VFC46_07260, partial [Humisphaera sp.]|nr:hypothetical protein [Humisphaera sp.]
ALSRAPDRRKSRIANGLFLTAPVLALGVITALYNQHVFGDWRRTGYQYWCPVPYDYSELVFSSIYLKQNLSLLTWKLVWMTIAFGMCGAVVLWKMRLPATRAMIFFSVVATVPLSVVYLFYFFKELRFYYPSQALLCILGGAGMGALIGAVLRRYPGTSTALAAAATLAILVPKLPAQPVLQFQPRRAVADAIAHATPANAIILTNMDPVYLAEFVGEGTNRKVWPVTRNMPYASRVIVGHRIAEPNPYPRNWEDQRMDRLLMAGGKPIFEVTAAEAPGRIGDWISAGIPVYLEWYPWRDEGPDDAAAKATLAKAFNGISDRRFPWLLKLGKTLP